MTRPTRLLALAPVLLLLLAGCASASPEPTHRPVLRGVAAKDCSDLFKSNSTQRAAFFAHLPTVLTSGQQQRVLAECKGADGASLSDIVGIVEKGYDTNPPTSAPAPAVNAGQTYSATLDEGNGFKQTVTITMSPAILGTKTADMKTQWKSVGGTGPVPCINVDPDNEGTSNYVLQSDTAVFAFGTLTIANDAPSFAAKRENYQIGMPYAALGLGYSNGSVCDAIDSAGALIQPDLSSSAKWGPVPIVVAVADVRSPAFPQGDPSKLQYPLRVNTLGFMSVPISLATP